MEIEKIEGKGNKAKFMVKGVNTTFMNSLRRTIQAEVRTFAIKTVNVYENTGVMFDEMLAHRIAMLPLSSEPKYYDKEEKVILTLEKEGPCTVYSKDIKSTEPEIEIVDKKVPITKLNKNQKIKLELEAVTGKGSTHSKWSPGVISFNPVPSIEASEESITPEELKELTKDCPKELIEVKGKKIVLNEPEKCDLCSQCVQESRGKLKINYSKDSFVLNIESFGSLAPEEMLEQAVEILQEKAGEFKKELSKA
ncbi:MAG: DNA-directed RNA polymerase subunit D [Candidatus Diapherotrites archaeon]